MEHNQEYNPDLVTVIDENGAEHTFEELDRIETDEGRFIALIPAFDESEEIIDSDGELIILEVSEDENGDTILSPIEDDNLFNKIGKIFEERLSDLYEIEEEQSTPLPCAIIAAFITQHTLIQEAFLRSLVCRPPGGVFFGGSRTLGA